MVKILEKCRAVRMSHNLTMWLIGDPPPPGGGHHVLREAARGRSVSSRRGAEGSGRPLADSSRRVGGTKRQRTPAHMVSAAPVGKTIAVVRHINHGSWEERSK